MTNDHETQTPTPAPTRNLVGVGFDTVLLLAGTYFTAVHGGALIRAIGRGGFTTTVYGDLWTIALFSAGVFAVCLSVPALQRNLRRVPRDASGRPLPAREPEAGERGE